MQGSSDGAGASKSVFLDETARKNSFSTPGFISDCREEVPLCFSEQPVISVVRRFVLFEDCSFYIDCVAFFNLFTGCVVQFIECVLNIKGMVAAPVEDGDDGLLFDAFPVFFQNGDDKVDILFPVDFPKFHQFCTTIKGTDCRVEHRNQQMGTAT